MEVQLCRCAHETTLVTPVASSVWSEVEHWPCIKQPHRTDCLQMYTKRCGCTFIPAQCRLRLLESEKDAFYLPGMKHHAADAFRWYPAWGREIAIAKSTHRTCNCTTVKLKKWRHHIPNRSIRIVNQQKEMTFISSRSDHRMQRGTQDTRGYASWVASELATTYIVVIQVQMLVLLTLHYCLTAVSPQCV